LIVPAVLGNAVAVERIPSSSYRLMQLWGFR
jgi:hypothetical protein